MNISERVIGLFEDSVRVHWKSVSSAFPLSDSEEDLKTVSRYVRRVMKNKDFIDKAVRELRSGGVFSLRDGIFVLLKVGRSHYAVPLSSWLMRGWRKIVRDGDEKSARVADGLILSPEDVVVLYQRGVKSR